MGAALAFTIVAILIWDRYLLGLLVARGRMPARHSRGGARLREAGYVIPVIPLLVGGQLMIWLTWPYHAAGALAGFGVTAVVCMFWRLALTVHPKGPDRFAVGQLSARRRRHRLSGGLGAAVRVVQLCCWFFRRMAPAGCSA